MTLSTRVKVTAYAVMAAYSVVLWLYGIQLPSTVGKLLGLLPLLVVGAFALLDNLAWRVGPLPRLLKVPVMRGTWHGTLTSYRRDDRDRRITSEHEIFLVIRQSLTSVSVTLLSAESKSRSAAAHLIVNHADDFDLQYQYANEPKLAVRDRSPAHVGGATIQVGGIRPSHLTGEYWTARETWGAYEVDRVTEKSIGTFAEGQQLLAVNPTEE